MGLLSIHVVSSDKDNNMFTSSFPDTNNSLEKHISDNSDNAGEGLSSHPCKGKFTPKMKVKGKGHTISVLVTKKQTAVAAKLKIKVALKLKAKFKIKSVK